VTITAVVEVPAELTVRLNATRNALRDNDSHIREDIELVFGDDAVIRNDLRVSITEGA